MDGRPYVLVTCTVSLDGYIDDASPTRLVLSNAADLDRVDDVRAGCDAILIGAETIRRDNPRLLVRSAARRDARVARGAPEAPAKVTVTESGRLDPSAQFFTAGTGRKLVYCASSALARTREKLVGVATVVDGGDPVDLRRILDDMGTRGISRLMVEGGGGIHTAFLLAGLADELHLVIAPIFVGDSSAPRFVRDGRFPWQGDRRAQLLEVRRIDDTVLLRYGLSSRCTPA